MTTITGRVIKYGDNVDTDVIIPAKYLVFTEPAQLAEHAMEGIDPEFMQKIKERTIVVAGRNFGCGSSREHAPLALKAAGTRAVVAESFARIFFRNAINTGLVVVESKGVSTIVEDGDALLIDLQQGSVEDVTRCVALSSTRYPEAIMRLIEKGGMVGYLIERLSEGEKAV